MAVIENYTTEDGDVLVIKPEAPIVGIIALYQFVDTTTGETETDYFRKEFRWSQDGGLTFSDWLELTQLNIQGVVISKYSAFVIEYRYTRVGTTPEITLAFEDILVSGEVTSLPYELYDRSIFSKFFNVNNVNVFGWALNVLEKLYANGLILPEFYERGKNQSNLEDEDFITFWNSITHFFAIIVYFARQFHNFETNQILLEEFLKSKDLTLPVDSNITDILYLYQNYVDEYKKRGTLAIIDQKENGADIDGELTRLIGAEIYEEFIFALFQNYETGWCIGKSSPLWIGTEKIINIIKGWEYTEEVVDLTKYPLLEDTYISIENDKMKLDTVPAATECGIGGIDTTKAITISPLVDYEISFRVNQDSQIDNLNFGCKAYDVNDNQVSLTSVATGATTEYFFQGISLNLVGQDYWCRGVLFNKDKILDASSVPTLGFGNNLVLNTNAVKIIPFITVIGDGSQITYLDNIKIRPRKLNFSRGQLGIHNIIYILAKNNNGSLLDEQIEKFIHENLVPYNSFVKTNWI